MIEQLYISKSFCCLGKNTPTCYGCSYCRLASNDLEFEYSVLPTDINKELDKVPVAVNLFYGDPLLHHQVDKTIAHLEKLAEAKHKGPVLIITKGDLMTFDMPADLDLDLHFAFSTFGIYHNYDKISHDRMIRNLRTFHDKGFDNRYRFSIEFRPVCYGINDSRDIIEGVFKIADKYGAPIGYSGLQGTPETVEYWNTYGINLIPYPGYKFGHKKSISEKVQSIFSEMSDKYNVPIFKKTSCLISHVHNLDRDYNAHYYRPTEMGCKSCTMHDKCMKFKSELSLDKEKIKHLVPFDFEIIYKKNHVCILKQKNICEFPTADCSNIEGNIIKIDEKITTADVRVIKWLTGYTVDADFYESSLLSNCWKDGK